MGKTNKSKEFLALNPWGKVPTLETDDGQGIWESNAIARYVARLSDDHTLFGTNSTEYGQVEQWVDWVRGDLEMAASVWLYPIYGIIPNCQQATDRAKEDVKRLMCVLNDYLNSRSYLVGDRVTLADIVVACSLVPLYTKVFDEEYRKDFSEVTRWFLNVADQPNFKKILNEITLCSAMEVAGGNQEVQQQVDQTDQNEPDQEEQNQQESGENQNDQQDPQDQPESKQEGEEKQEALEEQNDQKDKSDPSNDKQ